MPDVRTLIEIGGVLFTILSFFLGLQWNQKVEAEKRVVLEGQVKSLEGALRTVGGKLDDLRNRVTLTERDITHQTGAVSEIKALIAASTARLESQINHLQVQIVEALSNRKEG